MFSCVNVLKKNNSSINFVKFKPILIETTMKFLKKYYPILLAFISFVYSVYLWFTGNELEGIYVGLWPITILGFAIAIRQRRSHDK